MHVSQTCGCHQVVAQRAEVLTPHESQRINACGNTPLDMRVTLQGPGKKWEHYELTANGKPLRIPMHVKKGDTVQIISGDDKGKVGEIAKVQYPWIWELSLWVMTDG